MRITIILIVCLFTQLASAHNMGTELKKKKITRAIANITTNVTNFDISIEANPLRLDYDLQMSRFESGDKDIDKVIVKTVINGSNHELNCDLLSGEYGKEMAIYFLIYKNCELTNLDNDETKEVKLSAQFWQDWKY